MISKPDTVGGVEGSVGQSADTGERAIGEPGQEVGLSAVSGFEITRKKL